MLIKKQGQVIGLPDETRREADLWAALGPSLCLAACAGTALASPFQGGSGGLSALHWQDSESLRRG